MSTNKTIRQFSGKNIIHMINLKIRHKNISYIIVKLYRMVKIIKNTFHLSRKIRILFR